MIQKINKYCISILARYVQTQVNLYLFTGKIVYLLNGSGNLIYYIKMMTAINEFYKSDNLVR